MMAGGKCIKIRPNDLAVYSPAGHRDTYNRRLVGPEQGSTRVELILGEMGPQGIGEAHVHESHDQVLYLLEGSLKVTSGGVEEILDPGDLGFLPQGVPHEVICMSEGARFLVIFTPPME